MPKRQRTQWHYSMSRFNGVFRVGRVHNPKSWKHRLDIIRMKLDVDKKNVFDIYMRPDEAVEISAGLNHAMRNTMLGEGRIYLRKK